MVIETVAAPPYDGKSDLPDIARTLQLEIDDLFPVAEVLHYLGFAEIKEGDILLSAAARNFADLDTQTRKVVFARPCSPRSPLLSKSDTCSTSAPVTTLPGYASHRSSRTI